MNVGWLKQRLHCLHSPCLGTSVLSPGLHIGLLITLAIMIYKKSATQLFEKHSCLYVLTFGVVNAKISQKLVVRNLVCSPKPPKTKQ
ncbi:cholinephosphotransferase 1 isoform x2 [Limosa lapponica baueri]|uniref:Cholinephosphotransferase 1 isoform x2 n=1 Tax=Limosa lapponica baueri TaxID=1758121 RepID=A0A2I0SYW2_LIMLA|nr:cholinephosphotransferase 1 isoform x2 [Limosa lapponica baueri]